MSPKKQKGNRKGNKPNPTGPAKGKPNNQNSTPAIKDRQTAPTEEVKEPVTRKTKSIETPLPRLQHLWRSFNSGLVHIGTVVSIVGILVLWPRPLVTASDPVDSSNAFSASFTVRNAGWIPLNDVGIQFGLGQLSNSTFDPKSIPTFSRINFGGWQGRSLAVDEAFTITPQDLFVFAPSGPVNFADIAIFVVYKPWFLPFHVEKPFRFVTHTQTNGHLYWYSETFGRPPR